MFGSALLAQVLIRLDGTSRSQGSRCSPPTCLQVNMDTHTHSSEQNTQTQQQSKGKPLSAHVHSLFCPLCLSGSSQSISSTGSFGLPIVFFYPIPHILLVKGCPSPLFLSSSLLFSSLVVQPLLPSRSKVHHYTERVKLMKCECVKKHLCS